MKMIKAIIQPHRIDAVQEALRAQGISGMTTYQAQGFGRQRGHKELYRGAEYQISFRPKVVVELVIEDAQVEGAVEAIVSSARSGNVGDGKIFVTPVEAAVRIRTGEKDENAI